MSQIDLDKVWSDCSESENSGEMLLCNTIKKNVMEHIRSPKGPYISMRRDLGVCSPIILKKTHRELKDVLHTEILVLEWSMGESYFIIKYNNKYYDPENPCGVNKIEDISDLNRRGINSKSDIDRVKVFKQEFKDEENPYKIITDF